MWADGMGAWEQSEGCGALLAVGVVTCEEREVQGADMLPKAGESSDLVSLWSF